MQSTGCRADLLRLLGPKLPPPHVPSNEDFSILQTLSVNKLTEKKQNILWVFLIWVINQLQFLNLCSISLVYFEFSYFLSFLLFPCPFPLKKHHCPRLTAPRRFECECKDWYGLLFPGQIPMFPYTFKNRSQNRAVTDHEISEIGRIEDSVNGKEWGRVKDRTQLVSNLTTSRSHRKNRSISGYKGDSISTNSMKLRMEFLSRFMHFIRRLMVLSIRKRLWWFGTISGQN